MREDETSLFFCILLDLSSNLGGMIFEFSVNHASGVYMRRKIYNKNSNNKLIDDFLMNISYTTSYYKIDKYSTPNAKLITLMDMKDEYGNIIPANTSYTWTYNNGSFPSDVVTLIPLD